MWPGRLVGIEEELWGRAGQGQAEAGLLLALHSLLLHGKALPPTSRRCSHVLDTLAPRKPMGSPGLAALLLRLLQLLIGLSAAAGVGCPYLPSCSALCLLASHVVRRSCCCWLGAPGCHRLVKLPTLRLSFPATQVPEL